MKNQPMGSEQQKLLDEPIATTRCVANATTQYAQSATPKQLEKSAIAKTLAQYTERLFERPIKKKDSGV